MIAASVIIPTFNCANYLKRTLNGLANQSGPDSRFEVIVTDDGSTDDTARVAESFRSRLPLKFLENPAPRNYIGLASVRNRGILGAKHDVIVTLDADCIPVRQFLDRHLAHFDDLASRVVLGLRRFIRVADTTADDFALVDLLNLPDVQSASNFDRLQDRRIAELKKLETHPMPFNCLHTCNASFLRQDAFRAGMFDEAFDGRWGYEDIEFGYRLWRGGATFVYEPEALVLHQENEFFSREQRLADRETNFQIACSKIPGFADFRAELGR